MSAKKRLCNSLLQKGMKLRHIPTGRPVLVTKVNETAFEVITLDDEFGCRWRLSQKRISEFTKEGES